MFRKKTGGGLKKPVFRIRIHVVRIRIQHFRPNPIGSRVLMTKNLKKITAEIFFYIFGSKTDIYLSLGLHKGRPDYRRSLLPSKENIQYFKTWNFSFFSPIYRMWFILGLLDPDPDSGSTDLIESRSISDPDPKHWEKTSKVPYMRNR